MSGYRGATRSRVGARQESAEAESGMPKFERKEPVQFDPSLYGLGIIPVRWVSREELEREYTTPKPAGCTGV